jgi:two-component system, NtrC family, sensor kinase
MEFLGPPRGSFESFWIDEVWQTGRPKSVEHTLSLEGNTWWLSTQLIAIKDAENQVQGILGISRDVTEKKEMERHMIHTEKLASLGLLAAGVAHEINNPVGIILGYCDYLLEKIPTTDPYHDLLGKIERQGNICKKVVENLLSFSRSAEHLEGIGDINANLENILAILNKSLVHKHIEIRKELEPNLPRAGIDPIQLQQIFFNLIHNALGAMNKGGTLTLRSRWDVYKDRLLVEIGDTGSGIPVEYRTRIFDPFFTTKKVGEGTGLGLSVTYGIIKNHQGSISFETRTEEQDPLNHGTLFTIILPVYHGKAGARPGMKFNG